MLIRNAQIAAFKRDQHEKLTVDLVAHSRRFAPRLCHAAGDVGVTTLVRDGIDRALQYELEDGVQIRFYVELLLTLGSRFDTDPQWPWARDILHDRFYPAHIRCMELHREVFKHLEMIMGPDNEHAIAAVDRLLALPPDVFLAEDLNGLRAVRSRLETIFPQKADYLTDEQLRQLMVVTERCEAEFDLPARRAVIPGLLIAFGHGALVDPMYPWIARVLADSMIVSPKARLERLYRKLRTYAEKAREHLRGGA